MNKNIYIVWFQGFDNAPDLVHRCVSSWKYYNSDWNIHLLDNSKLSKYIQINDHISDISKINNTALSDVVRVLLLKKYGGLWVDATTYCNKPLNDWLTDYVCEGFFAFEKPGPDRLLSSWFLYADKDNYIIDKWLIEVINYYTIYNSPHTYFWFHYLFGDLYSSDTTFKEIWDKVPKLSANGQGPHYILESGLFNDITNDIQTTINSKITPLYKLTYKCTFIEYNESKILYYLYSTIKSV
jgi:hypothetical protein